MLLLLSLLRRCFTGLCERDDNDDDADDDDGDDWIHRRVGAPPPRGFRLFGLRNNKPRPA